MNQFPVYQLSCNHVPQFVNLHGLFQSFPLTVSFVYVSGDGRLCLAGFGVGTPSQRGCGGCVEESRGCQDAHISEGYLALSFTDRVECWNSERNEKKPGWSMVIPDNTGIDS